LLFFLDFYNFPFPRGALYNVLIEESVNRKVVELRDSTMREKKLIIHGIEESIAEDAATKKAADTGVVKDLFEQD
jgi:hypothetical protein